MPATLSPVLDAQRQQGVDQLEQFQ